MPSVEQITATVTEYAHRISTGTSAEIAALFAADAAVEDRVGAGVHSGTAAISVFFSGLDGVRSEAEVLTARVAGGSAAFHMRVTPTRPEKTIHIEPLDVMEFDEHDLPTAHRDRGGGEAAVRDRFRPLSDAAGRTVSSA
ncbi:nuclear transport factor 2 family protein [Nocardia rhamnosiphila]|uniref:nuclear transport factor 2 family protein n=1 Tax=Nocardia rhamnosiphila TaxID=426716 RepID=UPI00340923EB